MSTAADERFIRNWFEVSQSKVGIKWFNITKGGVYRKWYGNRSVYVNWENNGSELKSFKRAVLRNTQFYFNESICWNYISISKLSFKYYDESFAFTAAAPCIQQKQYLFYLLVYCNGCIADEIIRLIGGSTMTFEIGEISNLPILIDETKKVKVDNLVKENIEISKQDWDEFEISWDFKKHPLI